MDGLLPWNDDDLELADSMINFNDVDIVGDIDDPCCNLSDEMLSSIVMSPVPFPDPLPVPRPLQPSFKEKLLMALNIFNECRGDANMLAQVWSPSRLGDRQVLRTCEQPCLPNQPLSGYCDVSRVFAFSAEPREGGSFPGMPGRVFISQIPEYTSNVKYYGSDEFLRVHHAADHEVRATIGLPVFEEDDSVVGRSSCAVLELVTTQEKLDFDVEVESVCRALQAVDLCTTPPSRLHQSLSENQMAALTEIKYVLSAICPTYQLPLALTWIPCRGPNEKSILCIQESACYWKDEQMYGFVHACARHFLEEGQGIVGKAIQSNQPFFNSDVKGYHISEYPLVQHARRNGLNAGVAIRLRSSHGDDNNDYILEMFLPVKMIDGMEQQMLLRNLYKAMQLLCVSMRLVSSEELDGENNDLRFAEIVDDKIIDVPRPRADSLPEKIGFNPDKEKSRTKSRTKKKNISLSDIQPFFSGRIKDAAKSLGVSPTTLKKKYRDHGLKWPSRKINKVNHSLQKIKNVLDRVEGIEGALHYDPTTGELVAGNSTIQEFDTAKRFPFAKQSTKSGNAMLFNLKGSSSSSRSMEEKILSENNGVQLSIKATYKGDIIRFKLELKNGCKGLYEEVARRFNLESRQFSLNYLDNDWVTLETDSSLVKCLEIYPCSGMYPLKLRVDNVSTF